MRTHIRYPGTVLLLWVSCSSLEHAASPPPGAPACPDHGKSAPASPVLESLECRNDYSTHIRCSWTEAPGVPLSLFHLDRDENSVSLCMAATPLSPNALGKPRAQCRYNTSLFAIGFDNAFFFNLPHSTGLSALVNLSQHVDTREQGWTQDQLEPTLSSPPVTLHTLTSVLTSDPRASHQTPASHLKGPPESEQLVDIERLGHTDRKRQVITVERRERETDGLPGPFNLQCVYDQDNEVRCSWEMMRELSQYILYSLSYRTEPRTPPARCCAVLDEDDDEDGNDVVRFACSFAVSTAELLMVHLSPEPRIKVIESHKHIEPVVPVGLHVALIGGDWVLNWTLPKHRTVPISSELRYWGTHLPEDIEIVLLPAGVSVCVLAERSLRWSSCYLAQVRSFVSSRRGPGSRYAGPPSPWTQPVTWTTRPAPDSSDVYLVLVASVSGVLILVYFTLLAFHRRVRVWEVSLPSPFQSKVLKAVCQSRGERLPSHTEVDEPCMSEACVLTSYVPASNRHYIDVTIPPGAHSNGPDHYTYQEGCCMTGLQEVETCHFGIPYCPFQGSLSVNEDLMGVEVFMNNERFMCMASNSHNALHPCSDGYQLSPLASGNITQDALLNVGVDDVEMYDWCG